MLSIITQHFYKGTITLTKKDIFCYFQDYMDRYGAAMARVSNDFGPVPEAWLQRTEEDRQQVCGDFYKTLSFHF